MRIGINISNSLRERMKPLMAVSNISEICRDAIQAHVQNFERALQKAKEDGMEEIADRIAKEMSPETVDWTTLGLQDAKMWVQLAKAHDFERQISRLERFKKMKESPWTLLIEPVQGSNWHFHSRANEHEKWLRWIDQIDDENGSLYLTAKSEYERAYLDYILAVWQMVKDKMNSNNIDMENRSKEVRKNSLEDGLKEGKAKAEYLAKQGLS